MVLPTNDSHTLRSTKTGEIHATLALTIEDMMTDVK